MTETLSHIALRRLSGANASEWYTPFDGVDVSLNQDGCLVINAPEVCATTLTTNDIAEIDSDGRRFRIRGRRDNVVCSGGIKMQIEEIEAKLQAHTDVPLIITKRADEKFGEIIVLLAECNDIEPIKELCREWLSKYEQPHAYICVEHLPQTATGKPARAEAMRIASDYMIK